MRARDGKPQLRYDPFLDLNYFAETLLRQKNTGILTIGGGVLQKLGATVWAVLRTGRRAVARGEDVELKRSSLMVRPHLVRSRCIWGGRSGSPYSEAILFMGQVCLPPDEGGRFGEVFIDAMVGLPIMCAAMFERLGKTYKKASFKNKAD